VKFIRAFEIPGGHSADSGQGMQVRLQQSAGFLYASPIYVQHHFGTTLAMGAANLHDPQDDFAGFAMHCFVYASQRKADTYLWLLQKDNFQVIPTSLEMLLGDLRFVLEVELNAQRRLPHQDVEAVMKNLSTQGWHLQLPPQEMLAAAPSPAHSGSNDQGSTDENGDDASERKQE
jgi:uncharacterized protein